MAREIEYDLDEHGISLIDSMNNGDPKLFTAPAQALGIPWLVVLGGDVAGKRRIREIKSRTTDSDLVKRHCRTHSAGNLERQLLSDGLESELRKALRNAGHADAEDIDSAKQAGAWILRLTVENLKIFVVTNKYAYDQRENRLL